MEKQTPIAQHTTPVRSELELLRNRFNQVGSGAGPVKDCELRSMVTSIKEALVKEVLEKCLIKPNGE